MALTDRLKAILGTGWHVQGDAFCDQLQTEFTGQPDQSIGNLSVTGTITAALGNVTTLTAAALNVTGAIIATSLAASGAVTATSGNFRGTITGATLSVTGATTLSSLTVANLAHTGGTLGFFGATPLASAAISGGGQAAVSTGTLAGLAVTTTGIITTGIVAGFQTTQQAAAVISSINALMTAVSNVGHLANNLRAALVQTSGVGLIAGA